MPENVYAGNPDQTSPEFQSPFILKFGESPGYRLAVGSDHRTQVLMGVVLGYWEIGTKEPAAARTMKATRRSMVDGIPQTTEALETGFGTRNYSFVAAFTSKSSRVDILSRWRMEANQP